MALAYGTLIAIPDAQVEIETLVQGGEVVTFSAPADWSPATVGNVQGSGPQWAGTTMVFVGCDIGEFIATPDHVVVLADLTLVQAAQLTPDMSLLGADGAPRQVQRLLVGEFTAGICAIATDVPWNPESLAGRLLNTNGIVTGDYLLEINFEPGDAPRIGTPEYDEATEGPATESRADLRNL